MRILAGLVAGLVAIRGYLSPRDATRDSIVSPMTPDGTDPVYSTGKDLLIRRSWVRNPPGSLSSTTTYATPTRTLRSRVAGLLAGRPARQLTPEQIAQLLYIRQAERDRQLTYVRIALRSATLGLRL